MTTSFLGWTTRDDMRAQRPEYVASHLEAFRIVLLSHIALQAWAWVLFPIPEPWAFPETPIRLCAGMLTGLAFVAGAGWSRAACLVAMPVVAWETFWFFPGTPNHIFVSLVLLVLSALLDVRKQDEGRLLLQAVRWVAVLIFVWAGLQKALHGLYFRGEFLTWMVSHGIDRWADIFGWIVPESELARVTAFPIYAVGSGPYRIDSWLFIAVSNFIWVGEIAIGLGMLYSRTREWAALGGIVLVCMIQSAPREFMFALLYTSLLLLFVRGELNRRLLPVFLLIFVCMLAALLGAPFSFLLKAGGGL